MPPPLLATHFPQVSCIVPCPRRILVAENLLRKSGDGAESAGGSGGKPECAWAQLYSLFHDGQKILMVRRGLEEVGTKVGAVQHVVNHAAPSTRRTLPMGPFYCLMGNQGENKGTPSPEPKPQKKVPSESQTPKGRSLRQPAQSNSSRRKITLMFRR